MRKPPYYGDPLILENPQDVAEDFLASCECREMCLPAPAPGALSQALYVIKLPPGDRFYTFSSALHSATLKCRLPVVCDQARCNVSWSRMNRYEASLSKGIIQFPLWMSDVYGSIARYGHAT